MERVHFMETTARQDSIDCICRLKSLDEISFITYEDYATEAAVSQLTRVSKLVLRGCSGVGDSALSSISMVNHNITVLDIRGCKQVKDESIVSLILAQPAGQLKVLRVG